jgi:hypothetical protein
MPLPTRPRAQRKRTVVTVAVSGATAIAIAALVASPRPETDLGRTAPPAAQTLLPPYQAERDPATGAPLPVIPLPDGPLELVGTGAVIIIVTPGDRSWWSEPAGTERPPRYVLTDDTVAAALGFTPDQRPAWVLVHGDGSVAHRTVGPVERSEYATWSALLGAALP